VKPFFAGGICIAIFLLTFSFVSSSYSQDYRNILGKDYDQAVQFIGTNSWIADTLRRNHVDPSIGLAIIFPELIRYSSLRDKAEVTALATLYVSYGSYYSDFSIGRFQIKPSFAEKIEKKYLSCFGNIYPAITDTFENKDSRSKRVQRLDTTEGQVKYLIMFCRLMDQKYKKAEFPDDKEYLTFLATAYNTGQMDDPAIIRRMSQKKFFYIALPRKDKYNYAEISYYYFSHNCR
jgi:hypothetical protein